MFHWEGKEVKMGGGGGKESQQQIDHTSDNR
jgi:hypothetical protein